MLPSNGASRGCHLRVICANLEYTYTRQIYSVKTLKNCTPPPFPPFFYLGGSLYIEDCKCQFCKNWHTIQYTHQTIQGNNLKPNPSPLPSSSGPDFLPPKNASLTLGRTVPFWPPARLPPRCSKPRRRRFFPLIFHLGRSRQGGRPAVPEEARKTSRTPLLLFRRTFSRDPDDKLNPAASDKNGEGKPHAPFRCSLHSRSSETVEDNIIWH